MEQAALNRSPTIFVRERHNAVLGAPGLKATRRAPEAAGDAALHEPHVPRLALLVRLPRVGR